MLQLARLAFLVSLAAAVGACGDAAPADGAAAATYDSEAASSAEVAERMTARWEQRFAGVDSFAVEGAGLRLIYRATPDSVRAAGGLDWFQTQAVRLDSAALDLTSAELIEQQIPNVPRIAAGFTGATFGGVQTLGGRRGYVLSSEDPGALIGSPGNAGPDAGVTQTLRLLVDAETYDVLEVLTTVRVDSLERPLTQRLVYEDFRSEDGLTLPFTVRRVEEGMDQYVTDDQRMIQGGQLGVQKQRLEQQPPSPQRDADLKAVEDQLRMLQGGPRATELVFSRAELLGRR